MSNPSPEKMSVTISETKSQLRYEEETSTKSSSQVEEDHHGEYHGGSSSISEIEEEQSSDFFEINRGVAMETIREEFLEGSLFSFDPNGEESDCVYVGVGKSESSSGAVSWTLKNAIKSESTFVYLLHIFPEVHYIPSPLGKLPRSQVSAEQVESYMEQERGKRSELLQKFINMCSSNKVKVDTILIESDNISKAILDLIPILNIKKLVLGTAKSSLRKLRSRKGNGIVDQVIQNAAEYCEVKIICEGKEVNLNEAINGSPSLQIQGDDENTRSIQLQNSSPSSTPNNNNHNNVNDSFACMCFKSPKVI